MKAGLSATFRVVVQSGQEPAPAPRAGVRQLTSTFDFPMRQLDDEDRAGRNIPLRRHLRWRHARRRRNACTGTSAAGGAGDIEINSDTELSIPTKKTLGIW
jgi:hypothetical protein